MNINEEMAQAFTTGKTKSKGNTVIQVRNWQDTDVEFVIMLLHGNPIARREIASGKLFITLGGYPTPTTKARLNALPGVSVRIKAGQVYLNGEKWDGFWTEV